MTNPVIPIRPLDPQAAAKRLKKRYRAECRFRYYGILAISFAFLILICLLGSVLERGLNAFRYSYITLPITLSKEHVVSKNPDILPSYGMAIHASLQSLFPEVTARQDLLPLYRLISHEATYTVRDYVQKHPNDIGKTVQLAVPASPHVDLLMKGIMKRETPEHSRKLKDKQLRWLDNLQKDDRISMRFNMLFFKNADSREPESAGIAGAFIGSLWMLLVCLPIAFPLAVGTAIYLEEFAPKNRLTDMIEVNINNLAAVPSIVFGLLGLAVYLSLFDMPRSSALVGGLTLALMILPTIVITTRHAIRAIPPSIREGALALGASPLQTTFHHVLPLAMPGIMTGTILGIARALGETAPLLVIGMVAFIADVPTSILTPATVMPVQIFLWADSPELGFAEKTAGAIIILLILLSILNALAVLIRNRYEHRW